MKGERLRPAPSRPRRLRADLLHVRPTLSAEQGSFYFCRFVRLLTVCLFFRLSLLRSVKGERFERTGGATSGKNGELLYLLFVRIHTNCVFFCICRQACRRHRRPVSAVSGSSGREELRVEKMVSCFIYFLSEYILTAYFVCVCRQACR